MCWVLAAGRSCCCLAHGWPALVVFLSLPSALTDPLLLSPLYPNTLSRSGPAARRPTEAYHRLRGLSKPEISPISQPPLLQLPPSFFPKASQASDRGTVCSGNHLGGTRDSLLRKIQAGPTVHSAGREFQEQKAKPRGHMKTRGLSRTWAKELGKGEAGLGERRGRETHWWVQACVHFLPAPFHCPTPASQGSGQGGLGKRDVNGADGRRGLLTANCPLWLRL